MVVWEGIWGIFGFGTAELNCLFGFSLFLFKHLKIKKMEYDNDD